MFFKLLLLDSLILAMSVCMPNGAIAGETAPSVQVGRTKINLSGRQRMLSQRMAGASCIAMAGIDIQARQHVVAESHADFERALLGMQVGDANLGLPKETDPEILDAFSDVNDLWATVGPAVLQLAHGDMHNVVVRQLLELNVPLLTASNEAVNRIVARYGAGTVSPNLSNTINIAGRQRMLSQKMMKEACFLAVGLNTDHYLETLPKTMKLFETSLLQLQTGSLPDGIVAPSSAELVSQLRKVAAHWENYRATLSLIEPANIQSLSILVDLAAQSDAILVEMHKAVLLYVSN